MKNLIDLFKKDKDTFKEHVVNKLYDIAKNNIEERKRDIGNSIIKKKGND